MCLRSCGMGLGNYVMEDGTGGARKGWVRGTIIWDGLGELLWDRSTARSAVSVK